jgi:nucleotide-binding universal stress UspA family protein
VKQYALVAVGTDGSTSATKAVTRAAEVAADSGARLLVICAYEVGAPGSDGDGRSVPLVLGSTPAERALADAAEVARRLGVDDVETVAVEGDPAGALVDEVERRGAEVVVVGNKGLASFAGRLLGSVPAGVSRRARADVLIVHTT